jgi:death-on-curing protein
VRFLSLGEVVELHRRILLESGGSPGLRDLAALESAVAQPRITFGGQDLYPTLSSKASALGYALIQNHAFVDGNKRVGHAAMEVFLVLNGYEIAASVDESETTILAVASGQSSREELATWVSDHLRERSG